MRLRFAALALALALTGAAAGEKKLPEAADLLFETPQWTRAAPGTVLTYRYVRKTSDEALFGPSFADHIRLRLARADEAQERNVAVELFSGARRRAAGPFQDATTNPALLLFLEYHVRELSQRLKANPRYLKNAIRKALRDAAIVEATTIDVDGRPAEATRVVVKPFADDPNKGRMNGLDGLTFTFAVAESVPGQIAEIHAQAMLADGAVGLDERLTYDPNND